MSEKATAAAATVRPSLGQPVIITTRDKINGQAEHAAIITQVHSDDVVNVMVLLGTGLPFPIASVGRVRQTTVGSLGWRPRSRDKS